MYADDIVILADTPNKLQNMIEKLAEYCKTWGLTININKTKVLVFRQSKGRYCRNEKWFMNGQEVEKVRYYKYLGVIFAHDCTFHKHLNEKLKAAKTAINSTWKTFLGKKYIAHSVKFKLFEAAVRTIMGYASEVWGLERFEVVEKLLRYFIKRLFRLPQNTPNYMIYLETGLSELHIYFLKTHFNYMKRVMSMGSERLPKKIAQSLLETKSQCFQKWDILANNHHVHFNINETSLWEHWQRQILQAIDITVRQI